MKFFILAFLVLCSQIDAADECKDTSDKCSGWAKNGFCTNCFYTCEQREQYCAKTCEYCAGQKTCENCTVTTTTPPPSAVTIKCEDYGDFCHAWAKNGFCNNDWYKCSDRIKYCPKTCGYCSPGSCKDGNAANQFLSLDDL
ncbi:ShKT domain-containing protein [Caenorhabditis elegans]|uniref:ShKT domain-containing protein n=1 Tax=Caenorhabditis elegans TaxID=6239 RepID=Q7YWR4_CAEEL|nr:ShKT domain-containing protein [Caenorhabditis elegans]CAE17990.2 ShKT domain-containing protein [Caenorhabditis elegans]|eukprot:NP_001022431.2 Uncharacterized protein CELE_Y39G8B.10 [Caenorhabditis elegans]